MSIPCSSKTIADFQQTVQHYIPEKSSLWQQLWEPQILTSLAILLDQWCDKHVFSMAYSTSHKWLHSPAVMFPVIICTLLVQCHQTCLFIINYNTLNVIMYKNIKRNKCMLICKTYGIVIFSSVCFLDSNKPLISHKLSFLFNGLEIVSRFQNWNNLAEFCIIHELLHSIWTPQYSAGMGSGV
jgi:hypothetical protein